MIKEANKLEKATKSVKPVRDETSSDSSISVPAESEGEGEDWAHPDIDEFDKKNKRERS